MSYDASAELMEDKKGKLSVYLMAGSYNAGNQPEYGKEWEYFNTEVIKWNKNSGDTLIRKNHDNIVNAIHSYYRLREEYLKRPYILKNMTPTLSKKSTTKFTKVGSIIIAEKTFNKNGFKLIGTGTNKEKAIKDLK